MDFSDPELRQQILDAPIESIDSPGIGGRLRCRAEDFFVDEIPAYVPDGVTGRHLFIQVQKNGVDTPHCVLELCEQLGVSTADVGVAGRKDRRAVTRQWLSVPSDCETALERFAHPDITICGVEAHSQKLRRGHNLGNRFRIVVRDLEGEVDDMLDRARQVQSELERGVLNYFGPQRFGRDGANIESGLELLRAGRLSRPDVFLLSAGQSVLFNLYLLRRVESRFVDRLFGGELVRRTDSGGMFTADELEIEGPRLAAGELVITGPIYGAKMRAPSSGSAAAEFETSLLADCEVEASAIQSFGKKLPGARRPLRAPVMGLKIGAAAPEEGLSAGVALSFALPSGSYATRVVAEFQRGPGVASVAKPRSDPKSSQE
jgi:tRNA pseudouridine13 synthase